MQYVRWLDSGTHLSDGWMQLDVVRQQAKASLQYVDTVGFVVHEDEEVVVLGLSHDAVHDTVYGAQVIAKANIVERAKVALMLRVDPVAA